MKHLLRSVIAFAIVLFIVQPVYAVDWKPAETVTIGKDQTITGSLITAGDTIVVDGIVNGDLFCAGKKVTITGTVDGDLICAAQDMVLSGVVTGDARLAAQSLTIQGRIERNATLVTQSVIIDPIADVRGEVLFGSQSFLSKGFVGPLSGFSKQIDLAGEVKGDANLGASALIVRKDARIHGSLKYTSEQPAQIADGAAVTGIVSHVIPAAGEKPKKDNESTRASMAAWPANAVSSVVFYLLLSLVANALFSKKIHDVATIIEKKWLLSLGVGLLSLIALPFLSLFLLVTIIGILLIPVPILAAVVATGFGRIVAAQVFGKSVLKGFKLKNADNLYMQSLIGVPILWCMFKAPFIGGLFSFISIILGLGAFILSFKKSKK